ncbi:MAG: hypothetical protein IJR83_02865 [Clostridia bacterium]|nr:hypothetical protein [Clostridia bacterium]
MNIQPIAEFHLGGPSWYTHAAFVNLGDREALVVSYTDGCVDPGEELFNVESVRPMHLALFELDGTKIWDKTMPNGVLNGIWWFPVVPADLDGDGVEELYLIKNHKGRIFSLNHRVLERWDAYTGECTGSWPWPVPNRMENMSWCYRWYLVSGYVHGKQVLVTSQGTYGSMHLQCWDGDMHKRWELAIGEHDPGPRASHVTPVLDFNGDGVDELFWGERVISLDTGKILMCYAPEYNGHSDAIVPFVDYKTKHWYLYTNREGGDAPGTFRINTYDLQTGKLVWGRIPDTGHIHKGWVATLLDGHRRIAMAQSQHTNLNNPGLQDDLDGYYFYDAITGKDIDYHTPIEAYHLMPVDINGDGYHELVAYDCPQDGTVWDRHGNKIGYVGRGAILSGKLLPGYAGEQLMVRKEGDNSALQIMADLDAVDGDIIKYRYSHPFLDFMQRKMTATGYNSYAAPSI